MARYRIIELRVKVKEELTHEEAVELGEEIKDSIYMNDPVNIVDVTYEVGRPLMEWNG